MGALALEPRLKGWRLAALDLMIEGVRDLRRGLILMLVGATIIVAWNAALQLGRAPPWTELLLRAAGAVVDLVVFLLFYRGFANAADYEPRYEVGKWGAVLLLVGGLIGNLAGPPALASGLSLPGLILVLVGFHRLGELDPSDNVSSGVILLIVGYFLLIILIGVILALWGTIKMIRGLGEIENHLHYLKRKYLHETQASATTTQEP